MIQVAERVWGSISEGLNSGKTIISEQGSSRSAKTYNTVIWLVCDALKDSGSRTSVVRKTLPALKGSVLIDFKEILNRMQIWDSRQFNKTELIYTLPNKSWFEFFSTDDEQKIRGRKRDKLFVNEANEISYLEWQQLIMRTTKYAILDYNPSFSEDHWIESVNKDPDCYHFISTYKDNPFLEQKIVDDIEKLQGKNKSLWTVYGLGLRAVIEGRIFEDYEIVEEIPGHVRKRWVGMDFGYTNDPTAILNVAIDGEDLYMDEICYRTRMLTNDIIKVLKEYCQDKKIISESADPRLIDEIHNAGLNIHAVEKFQGSINAGLAKMKEYNIKITKRSTNIKKEIDNYVYDQDRDGKYLNQPVDEFNHCFVATTKIITREGIKNICDITTSDRVLTSKGFNQVIKLYNNGCKQVNNYLMQFDTFNVSLCCTSDHLIKTTQGWKQISQLESGMQVFLNNHLTGKHTDSTQKKDIFQGVQKECTLQFGNFIMVGFSGLMKFITLMKTRGITDLRILKLRKNKNTSTITEQKDILQIRNGLISFIQQALRRLKNGITLKKEKNGIQNTLKKLQKRENLLPIFVNNAVIHINQILFPRLDFVQIVANHSTEGWQDLTMKQERVLNAERLLQSTNTQKHNFAISHVLENIIVENENIQPVYDIHIDSIHEYFANGVLVHNSIDGARYVILEEVIGKNRKKSGLSSLSGRI
jgi:phage terminase large subunit